MLHHFEYLNSVSECIGLNPCSTPNIYCSCPFCEAAVMVSRISMGGLDSVQSFDSELAVRGTLLCLCFSFSLLHFWVYLCVLVCQIYEVCTLVFKFKYWLLKLHKTFFHSQTTDKFAKSLFTAVHWTRTLNLPIKKKMLFTLKRKRRKYKIAILSLGK